ncbi:MAG TPA: response regulator transcription factor [Gemmatimonadales bacterium]|nr:response regulator transcription factor [Gemmatimonadales bacterium]
MDTRPPGPPSRPRTVSASLPRGNGELVLLVDDYRTVREATARLLVHLGGYTVVDVASGVEALAVIRALDIRLVVTDWCLPDMGGAVLVERIRFERPTLPILVITGHEPEAIRAQWPLIGPHTVVLGKPTGAQELLGAVRSLLRRGSDTERGGNRDTGT